MPATYEPIATTTLGSAAANITFSSITSAYTDLRVVLTATANSGGNARVRFNSDTTALYSNTRIIATGSGVFSGRTTGNTFMELNFSTSISSTIPIFITADIFSYAGSTNKTSLITVSQDLNGSGMVERSVGLWRDSSAINNVQVSIDSGTFAIGTTATLYGILKA